MRRLLLVLIVLLLSNRSHSVSVAVVGRRRALVRPSINPFVNKITGGAQDEQENDKNVTLALDRYVAAMEEQDNASEEEENAPIDGKETEIDTNSGSSSSSRSTPSSNKNSNDPASYDPDAAVGVKHPSKKSNAVGDPDGNSSDDTDDDTDSSEWEEFLEEMQELGLDPLKHSPEEEEENAAPETTSTTTTELQVEMELMKDENDDDSHARSSGGGNVGVRLANRLAGRRSPKSVSKSKITSATTKSTRNYEAALRQAWLPHVYLPFKDDNAYLEQHARSLDADSKSRLDRRTLYGSLLLEWMHQLPSSRKYLDASTSQQLLAALSLATQPKWRKSFPQANCISLNDDSTTLAMQETIAMSMAHSLGCGMVMLDDEVLDSVRQELARGVEDGGRANDEKPVSLLKSLLSLANEGKLAVSNTQKSGSIAAVMEKELAVGLDDPFDERAVSSAKEMMEWETQAASSDFDETTKNDPLPLVIFIRTESATSLLKSKSAVEQLLQECTSSESIHLIVLGKGIHATTETLPSMEDSHGYESEMSSSSSSFPQDSNNNLMQPMQQQQQQQGGSPWFGFSPQNQNASGLNDPEGSRRFNIFLARTTDRDGTPGILGAIAPPQAGNLFPHIMALQARERLEQQNQSPDNNRWSEQLVSFFNQQQQQQQNGQPFSVPQFFNATLVSPQQQQQLPFQQQQQQQQPNAQQQQLPPEVVQHALQHAMSDLLDRLAQVHDHQDNDDSSSSSELHPDLHRAFGQVLRNENLRRGIAENLARAAPALTDPKCQGVMLSVYVPPPPHHANSGKLPGQQQQQNNSGSSASVQPSSQQQQQPKQPGWFHKILNQVDHSSSHGNNNNNNNDNNDDEEASSTLEEESKEIAEEEDAGGKNNKRSSRKNRIRALAAAQAALDDFEEDEDSDEATTKSDDSHSKRVDRNLQKLETLCRHVPVKTPVDPVRAKSWEAWIARERGAVVFRQNRRSLNSELLHRRLLLQQYTGTRGVGSSLRQMLSVRNVADEMPNVIKCAVELEAAKSRRHETNHTKMTTTKVTETLTLDTAEPQVEKGDNGSDNIEIDVSLHQLLVNDDGEPCEVMEEHESFKMQYIHPSSLESALALTCRLNPSPSGGGMSSSSSTTPASHRSKEDILALAQDKHERALVSQVVSPQDIGVTYDMIGGLTNVKELLRQSITYPLKFPHLYSEGIAREAVKGVLLFGPPGTGKTMLAKAVATEGGASFLSVDASSVENKWLGESEKNAKAVFTLARRLAPCVIFIDEVDSLLSSREGSSDDSAHGTLTSVKTTMMSEWDGLNSGTNGSGEAGSDRVVVIGSTNRPFDLDEAVLRRFPRRILVDLPDLETRQEILEVTLAENRLDPAVNLTQVAERLEGYTGSDIKEVCREAVVQISHEQARLADQGALESGDFAGSFQRLRPVTTKDFDQALSKLKKSVSERGRELSRVWEWNDEYGEIKREKRDHLPQLMNMFL